MLLIVINLITHFNHSLEILFWLFVLIPSLYYSRLRENCKIHSSIDTSFDHPSGKESHRKKEYVVYDWHNKYTLLNIFMDKIYRKCAH